MNDEEGLKLSEFCKKFYFNKIDEYTMNATKQSGIIFPSVSEKLTPEQREELRPFVTYKIEGIREEKYMGEVCDDYGEYHPEELTKYFICCSINETELIEIELYNIFGMCPSGYCSASWGEMELHRVDKFGEMTHIPKEPITFELDMYENGFECPAFNVSFEGPDEWYPTGGIEVNMQLFKEKEQQIENTNQQNQSNDVPTQEEYTLEDFIKESNEYSSRPYIKLKDGTAISIQANSGAYCEPRVDGLDSYEKYEIACQAIDELEEYFDSNYEDLSIYANVPQEMVKKLILEHGGIDRELTFENATKMTDQQKKVRDMLASSDWEAISRLVNDSFREKQKPLHSDGEIKNEDNSQEEKQPTVTEEPTIDNPTQQEKSPSIDDMSIEELLAMEAETDERIKKAEAEIERQKVLERLKGKMELARQKETQLRDMRQNRSKQPQQLGQDIELH